MKQTSGVFDIAQDKDIQHSTDSADWVETSMADDVLLHSDKFPASLSSATNEDVSTNLYVLNCYYWSGSDHTVQSYVAESNQSVKY